MADVKIAHDDRPQALAEVEGLMCKEYNDWVDAQGLPSVDAEELLFHPMTYYQRVWVSHFILRWDAMRKQQDAARAGS